MESLRQEIDDEINPKKENLSLGFGFFSTAKDENDWNWLPYDGMESTEI